MITFDKHDLPPLLHTCCPLHISPYHPLHQLYSKKFHDNPSANSDTANLEPDSILPPKSRSEFQALHDQFGKVFSPDICNGYNGAIGPFQTKVNMGPVQPKLVELHQKFDELEGQGIFCRP